MTKIRISQLYLADCFRFLISDVRNSSRISRPET